MYVYPAIKTNTLPTQQQWNRAQRLADEDTASARDVRPLMSILMRLRRADPRLRGHILTRKTAVSSFSWGIMPTATDPTPKDTEMAEKARMRCSALIKEVIAHRIQASLYDVMCIKSRIDNIDGLGKVQIPELRYRPVELEKTSDYEISIFEPNIQKKNIIAALTTEAGLPNDFRAEYTIAVSDDDERGGLLRSIALHEIMLYEDRKEWGNYNKLLAGLIQAIVDEGADSEEVNAAATSLQELAKRRYSVTTNAVEYKFNQLTQSGAAVSFKDFSEALKADIALTLLGQVNTAELPKSGGSRAALQVLNMIRADIMFDDMIQTETCINNQVLLNDARLNYDVNLSEAPYRFTFNMPDALDPETQSRIMLDAYNGGIELMTSEAYRSIGMTPPPGTGDTIQKNTGLA